MARDTRDGPMYEDGKPPGPGYGIAPLSQLPALPAGYTGGVAIAPNPHCMGTAMYGRSTPTRCRCRRRLGHLTCYQHRNREEAANALLEAQDVEF